MKKPSPLKKEKQPKMKISEKWKFRKSLKFISRLDSTTHEETLFEICKNIKLEDESDELIPQANINYIDVILLTEVLLLIIKTLLEKSLSLKNTESINKLNTLRHQIYYKNFDQDVIIKALERINDNLKSTTNQNV